METFCELIHAPKWVQLLIFFGFSLFFVVVLVVIIGVTCSVRQDIHLRKHYFEQWKLKRGSPDDRKRVVIPSDLFLNKLTSQNKKFHYWIMIIWFALLLIMSLIIIFV